MLKVEGAFDNVKAEMKRICEEKKRDVREIKNLYEGKIIPWDAEKRIVELDVNKG